jgi:hypothetical protein
MSNYSIEKVGSDYVVKVDDQQVMKLGSRRRAAQLVVNASELLDDAPLVPRDEPSVVGHQASEAADAKPDDSPGQGASLPSITRDSPEVA